MNVSRIIAASRRRIYDAFMDAAALAAWLPPKGMHGEVQAFDPQPGGGYRMTLTYDAPSGGRGKTTADSDTVAVRFVELVPGERIVQAVEFASDEAAYGGVMTLAWSFAEAPGGTEVMVSVENPPPGVSEADHQAGIASSLDNLARFVGQPNPDRR
ncbi:MAG: ATPase [Phenylobacterium sp.]|jgi:uncharacterized protein YndB with AHSA1/START domain|nr:ATPase [Phenylobacterium sp.]